MRTKAYKVEWDDEEGRAEIVFASSPSKAKTGVGDCDADFVDRTAVRAPEFDRYADGGLTTRVLLEHGWWHGCMGCDEILKADCDDDGDAEGIPREFYETARGDLYCSEACCERRFAERGRRSGAVRGAQLECLDRWPGIKIVRAEEWNREGKRTPSVAFTFPGCVGFAEWERGAESVLIHAQDEAAWRSFTQANVQATTFSRPGASPRQRRRRSRHQ